MAFCRECSALGAGLEQCAAGISAAPNKQANRQWIAAAQLPDALKRLRALEKRVNDS